MFCFNNTIVTRPFLFSRLDFNGGLKPPRNNGGRFPQNNHGPKNIPPSFNRLLWAVLITAGLALLLGVYKGVENIQPMDIFIVAVLGVILSRILQRAVAKNTGEGGAGDNRKRENSRFDSESDAEEESEAEAYWRRREEEEEETGEDSGEEAHRRASGAKPDPWAQYRSLPKDEPQTTKGAFGGPSTFSGPSPQGFDREELITGAKILFEKVQESLGGGDLARVRDFLSPQALSELEEELREEGAPQARSVLMLEASVRDILEQGEGTSVTVTFNAMLHKGADDAPHDVEAVWRFSRESAGGNWRLDSTRA